MNSLQSNTEINEKQSLEDQTSKWSTLQINTVLHTLAHTLQTQHSTQSFTLTSERVNYSKCEVNDEALKEKKG